MIEQDTVKLLRECDAGVKMGVASINDVVDKAHAFGLRDSLIDCRQAHTTLGHEIRARLDRFGDQGKTPNPVARNMSRAMTGMKLAVNRSDSTIADLMTDGCNMGVKSLNRYLNQYRAADEVSKDITKRLIHLEEQLAENVRPFL